MSPTSRNKDPDFVEISSRQEDLDENTSTEMAPKSVTVADSDGQSSYSIGPCSPQQRILPEDLPSEVQEQIHELALQITQASRASINTEDLSNPFIGSSDPTLDPHSDSFNFKSWLRNLGRMASHEKDRSPHPKAGVSFRNLNVHGFGSLTDYQKDFANVLLEGVDWVQKLTGQGQNRIQILKEFDGLVKEGEMLVVLGSPGSGCSTLLKTIAGETDGFYVDPASELNYQGIPKELMYKHFRGEIIYNAETEIHFPNLTVGQTLSFAAKARVPRNRPQGVTRQQYADHFRDVAIALFGLSHTVNTRVGNEYIRGVSGGERKRVSIAEAFLAGCTLQCWDNSTRGLDSATTLKFVKTLRTSSSIIGTTSIVAIYQASQTAYDVFDKVTLLYKGRQIFFGQTDRAKEYFENLGFYCPERQTTADFLTSITSPSERIVKPGFEQRVPRSADEFAEVWKRSPERMELLSEIQAFERDFELGGHQLQLFKQARRHAQANYTRPGSPYTLSAAMQIRLCMTRGIQRLVGDMSLFWTSVLGLFFLALIIGSVFYDLPESTSSFYSRGALLFLAILLNALNSALEILTLYAQRPIVEKHAKYAFYHPFAEAFSSMVCDLPAKILTSISFNLTIYFMSNLRREPGAFFTFFLFSFVMTLTMSMIFRTIASFSRTLSEAMVPASFFMLSLVIYTGFAIPTRDMHVYFRWINYINPIGYAFESLMINEFHNRQFPCSQFVPEGPGYGNISNSERVCSMVGSIPGSNFVDGDRYIGQSYEYFYPHLWRNLGIILSFTIFFLFTYLVGTEYISAAHSKGEVLVFKRGHIPAVSKSHNDEESSPPSEAPRVVAETTEHEKTEQGNGIFKQTATFHWRDVCYDIKIKGQPRRLLDHVDGWIQPGTLTALMGVSGAGKTTLLDVLASRTSIGTVSGDMLVNGHQRDQSFQRKTGYVQQLDLHLETSTVREALLFSAFIRQPYHISREEKVRYVDEVIKMLEIEEYSDAVVGVQGEGLNVEQRKRLTIGVELAAKPELLVFLDEPTSGLDSQTAWSILTLIRKLANNGQAILCTIHQPSAMLFQSFDRLLLLAEGGKTVYFGEIGQNSRTLIEYFKSKSGLDCSPEANPAEWILDQLSPAPGQYSSVDWSQAWRDSRERAEVRHCLDDMEQNLSKLPVDENKHLTRFATPFWYQTYLVTLRCFEQYWRTPSYLYSKCALCILPTLFIGFSFFKAENTIQGLQNQMFAVFMLMTIFGNLAQQIMPQFCTQRALFEARERQSKSHSWQSFIVSNIVVELPWNALMALLMFFSWYYPIGLYRNAEPTDTVHERGALMFLFILAFLLFTSTFTNMVIAGIEVAETGATFANLMFSLTLIFCGVLATPQTLPGFWIFMYRISPFNYLISGMLSVGLANQFVHCSPIEVLTVQPPPNTTCGTYLSPYISFAGGAVYNPEAGSDCQFCSIDSTNVFLNAISAEYSEAWRNFGLLWCYIVFNVAMTVVLYWVVRMPKKWGVDAMVGTVRVRGKGLLERARPGRSQ